MKKRKVFWATLIFSLLFFSTVYSEERRNPFSVEWNDAVQQLRPGEIYSFRVKFHIPEGYYLYQDKTEVLLTQKADLTLVKKEVPSAQKKIDKFFNREIDAYLKDFEITYLLQVPQNISPGRRTLEGEIRYQGCSPEFCYRPMKVPLLLPLEIVTGQKAGEPTLTSPAATGSATPSPSAAPPIKPSRGFFSLIKEGKIDFLMGLNPFWVLLVAFLAGILTDFTPCVLPIIPLTLAVVGIQKNRSFLKNLGLSLSLVLGMALTYAILGLISAFLGLQLGFLFQSRYFLIFLILFFLFMSVALLGWVQLELPGRFRNFLGGVGGVGYKGAFLAGLTIGFIASPCVGPLVGPLLLWVAQAQSIPWGTFVLLTYGLGMGTLFLFGGTFYSTLGSRLRGGRYTEKIKKALALLMLAPALYYGYVLYQQSGAGKVREGWVASLEQGLERAQRENKPILIDFYADWCLPCLELDKKTFSENRVKKAVGEFVAIKIDCTLENSNCAEAVKRFGVVGWPTILFLDKDQRLLKDLSIVGGFVGPDRFLELLEEVKRRG